MSKKNDFIDFIKKNIGEQVWEQASEDVKIYWNAFCSKEEKEKPILTDNGKTILRFLQDNDTRAWKARDIAEELFISARTVSGGFRKLVLDGFVEKIGENPASYLITEKGKNIVIE